MFVTAEAEISKEHESCSEKEEIHGNKGQVPKDVINNQI